MVLRDLSSDWWDLRDLSTGRGVLGDHSLDLADPRDLSIGWGVLGDLSFDWDPSSELNRDLVFSWNLTWDCGLFW